MNQKEDSGPKKTFGPFTVLKRLGVGKYSEVFKVQKGNSVFALKKIKPHYKYDHDVKSALIAEANILGLIKDNRHFPIFYETGELEDSHYILMEYINGFDIKELLSQSIARQQKLSWQEACAAAAEVCQGLEHLHSLKDEDGRTIIHKDIKPSNILISDKGEIKLIDLGLKHTTLKYLPLESIEQKRVTPYSDIFATGNIFYEMLHAQPLFKSESDLGIYFEMKELRFDENSFDRKLPEEVRKILAKSIDQFSKDRYQTIGEFKDDLLKLLKNAGSSWNPAEMGKKVSAFKDRPLTRPIEKRGRFLNIDSEGFFINDCDIKKIRSPWKEAVEAIKQSYLKNLVGIVHSIYIRGSVARGEGIEGVSDIDSLAVVYGNPNSLDLSWVQKSQKSFKERFPFSPYVEFDFVPYESLLREKGYFSRRFIIKVLSTCVYGEDLAAQISKFRPSLNIAFFFHGNINQVLNQAMQKIRDSTQPDQIRAHCAWVMKRILRTGFGLTIEKEQAFTRDLLLCYEIFSKYYPEQESQMRQALEWSVNPTDQKKTILDYLSSFGIWLADEAKKKFSD